MHDVEVLPFQLAVESHKSTTVPVSKVFLRQRLDMLAAQAWLNKSAAAKQNIVDISCRQSMPSPFTTLLAVESSPELDALLSDKKSEWYRRRRVVKALAASGAIVVGAAVITAGSLAATAANISIGGTAIGDMGCCEDISESCSDVFSCFD
jgi:hypothetical protein